MNELVKLEDLHEAIFEYSQSDSYLTFAQAWDAKDFMKKHLPHIFGLINELEEGYPPTLQKEKNNPSTWKPEHWFWFIQKYIGR